MATMTKTPQLNLPDYISKISEHADVRVSTDQNIPRLQQQRQHLERIAS